MVIHQGVHREEGLITQAVAIINVLRPMLVVLLIKAGIKAAHTKDSTQLAVVIVAQFSIKTLAEHLILVFKSKGLGMLTGNGLTNHIARFAIKKIALQVEAVRSPRKTPQIKAQVGIQTPFGFQFVGTVDVLRIVPKNLIVLRQSHRLLSRSQYGKAGHEFKGDRKSTRLNSSHVRISYAVFCLKK